MIYAPFIAITNIIAGMVGFLYIARTQPHRKLALRMIVGAPCLASLVIIGMIVVSMARTPSDVGPIATFERSVTVGLTFAVLAIPGAWMGGILGRMAHRRLGPTRRSES